MIAIDLPPYLLWLLRWLLFLGPFGAVVYLCFCTERDERTLVGCLFAFLYGLGLIFLTHTLANYFGFWSYGGEVLMLNGIPADILIGGAILFGPVLYLAFPTLAPFWWALPIVIFLHGLFFSSLRPLVYAGRGWYFGVVAVFAVAHIPAVYLARWTSEDRYLPFRSALLALGYGCLAFILLPALIAHAMGEQLAPLSRPVWLLSICACFAAVFVIAGLSAVLLFVVHGNGTPIPLDPTKRLVRVGLFSYVINPMQVTSAAIWILLGLALGSVWIAAAAIMAWVFVAGMVRWHHRNDLLKRFPEGWPEYRQHVPEWFPQWRPWIPHPSTLKYDPQDKRHAAFKDWLEHQNCAGLTLTPIAHTPMVYMPAEGDLHFAGSAAAAKALDHVHLVWALVGAALLLVALPYQHLAQRGTHQTADVDVA